ncbi:tRNA dihydrouridine(20/20a) synthase DusA [uncultured Thalassolituus sp.]|mgnify:CR=1 FL=1|uniref:tRNA dihydrouridine(20/20a) synthase DusA n=1 Tax=uncultured Thalassolituus sp. TaxID=285273 RepID=UPI00261212C1|nr:tRNA dihydrouridine(20/20a) synthase DusA [uncultured Thalassolituus sp.]
MKTINRTFSTAPMMDWSDRHCRYFWRQLTRDSLLYTEMVTTGALIHGDRERFLAYHDAEHPIALQLGGSNPDELAQCAKFAEEWHYDEVNLNVGCPSDRVQNNMIGACLMAHPQLVADCVKAMQDATSLDVTVKHRIGIDDQDSYEEMRDFVGTVADTGCKTFIVHARKAILSGLSPKENREIPPLRYEDVFRLKREFPGLEIIINGGITTHDQIAELLTQVDGVMLGREAYHNPSILMEADQRYFSSDAPITGKGDAIRSLYPYIETLLAEGAPLHYVSRHTLGLFNGERGSRLYRRHLSENAYKRESGTEVMEQALAYVGY